LIIKSQNDDTNSIDEYYNYLQLPNNLTLQPGEIFVFSKEGGEDYDNLEVYLVDQNLGTGKIINVDSNNFAKIILDHLVFMNTDFLTVPNIDDGFSSWKLIIVYENNNELVLYFKAYNVTIED
jgi:hypothetical protein